MSRRDHAYWKRLRKDRGSNAAAMLGIASGLVALISLIGLLMPGSQTDSRANPFYWAMLLPFGWWGASLAGFEPWAVRLFRPAITAWLMIAAAALAGAIWSGRNPGLWVAAFAISVVCSAGAEWSFRRSLLLREGPAR